MRRIGRYEVVRELGNGGFGRVYAAFDPTVGRPVAIKTLSGVVGPDLLARFRNEAATAGRLRHQNIVTIFDFGADDGSPFLVMELLEGEDLQRVVKHRRELSIYGKVRILWEVADALKHAHANGVVHRDIKPANIMLLSDYRIKLLDFGIAWVAQAAMSRLTPQGNVIGTFRYMAPEQFRGDLPDARGDIFAYGIVCYELLTGVHPFRADDEAGIMYQIVNGRPARLSEHSVDCPPGLEPIIVRALEKDPEARYQSLEDIQFDLEPILLELRKQQGDSVLAEAERRFAAGQLEAAHALIREALELGSGTAARRLRDEIQHEMQQREIRPKMEALIEIAEKRAAAREFDEAVRNLESALRLDPTNSAVRQKIHSIYAARELFRGSEHHTDLAKRAFCERNLTAALEHANEALLADPQNDAAKKLLGEIHAELTRREHNRRVFELLGKAKALLLTQNFDEADELLGTADAELSDNTEIREMLARVQAERAAHEREARLLAEISAARETIRGGEFEAAIDRLSALEKEFPRTAEIRDLLKYAEQQSRALQIAATVVAPADSTDESHRESRKPDRHGSSRKFRWNWERRVAAAVVLASSTLTIGGHSRATHSRPVGRERTTARAAPDLQRGTGVDTATVALQKKGGATDLPSRPSETLGQEPTKALPTKRELEAPQAPGSGGNRRPELNQAAREVPAPPSLAPSVEEGPKAATAPSPLNTVKPADSNSLSGERTPANVDPAGKEPPVAPPPVPENRRAPEEAPLRPLNGMDAGADTPPSAARSLNAGSAMKPNLNNDHRQILDALARFEEALANRSLAQLDAAWPGMPRSTRDNLRKAFRDDNIRYTVRLTPLDVPVVDGNLATVDCERVGRTTVAGDGRPGPSTIARATLKKQSNIWVIQSIQDLR